MIALLTMIIYHDLIKPRIFSINKLDEIYAQTSLKFQYAWMFYPSYSNNYQQGLWYFQVYQWHHHNIQQTQEFYQQYFWTLLNVFHF